MSVTTSAVLGLVCLALLSTTVVEVNSAPNIEDPSDNKGEYPCTYHDVKFKEGEWSAPVGDCTIVTCNRDGTYMLMTCAEIRTNRPHCSVTPYDNTLQYPDCCPNITCGEPQVHTVATPVLLEETV